MFTAFMLDLYAIRRLKRVDRIFFNLIRAGIINGFVIAAILFSLNDDSPFSREHLYYTYSGVFILVLLWRYLSIKLIFLYRRYGYNYDKVTLSLIKKHIEVSTIQYITAKKAAHP